MVKLKISVERIDGYCNLPMLVGDHLFMDGGKLKIPAGKHICMWALQSMMPIFPVLQHRDKLDDGHWMKTVKNFTCPDPEGQVIYRLDIIEE